MKGIILTYNVKDSYNITKLNNKLFGRIVRVSRKNKFYYYYYQGELDSTQFYKIGKGCYFIRTKTPLSFTESINSITCTLELQESDLQTPREYFQEKYLGKEVINL